MERKQYGQPDFIGPPTADELEAEKRSQQTEFTEPVQPVKTHELDAPAASGIQNDHEYLGSAIRDIPYAQAEFEKGDGHQPLNEFEQAKFENEPGDGFSIDHDGVDRDGDDQDYDNGLDYD